MIKQQVEIIILAADFHVILPANKRETNAEFEQEFLDVVEQTLFEVALMRVAVEREEIEIVGVFERLFGEIGLRRRQGALKVGDGFAFALVQLRLNVVREHRAGPAVFDGLVGIPEADGGSLQLGQEQAIMSPRQFRNGRWRSRCGRFSHRL